MAGILSPSPFQISKQFPIFDPQFSELLAEVQGGSKSGEQLLSICASLAESESTVAFVSSRASSRYFWFVDPTSGSPSIGDFLLGSSELRLFSIELSPLFSKFFFVYHHMSQPNPSLSLLCPLSHPLCALPPPPPPAALPPLGRLSHPLPLPWCWREVEDGIFAEKSLELPLSARRCLIY
jgi:hypothetical protein